MVLGAVAGLAAAVVFFGLGFVLGRRRATPAVDAATRAAEEARAALLKTHAGAATETVVSVWRRYLAAHAPGEQVRDLSDLPYSKRRLEEACLLALAASDDAAQRAELAQAVRHLARFQAVGSRRRFGAMHALAGNTAIAVANDVPGGPADEDAAIAALVAQEQARIEARLAPLL